MITEEIEHSVLIKFESAKNPNIYTSHYSIADHCPSNEARCYKVVLEESDIQRIFLVQGSNFTDFTENSSLKLIYLKKSLISQKFDTEDEIRSQEKIRCLLGKEINLSTNDNFAPVFISTCFNTCSLIAIDGNHRLMAHFLMHGNIKDVQAYLFVHSKAINSGWFPPNTQ